MIGVNIKGNCSVHENSKRWGLKGDGNNVRMKPDRYCKFS